MNYTLVYAELFRYIRASRRMQNYKGQAKRLTPRPAVDGPAVLTRSLESSFHSPSSSSTLSIGYRTRCRANRNYEKRTTYKEHKDGVCGDCCSVVAGSAADDDMRLAEP